MPESSSLQESSNIVLRHAQAAGDFSAISVAVWFAGVFCIVGVLVGVPLVWFLLRSILGTVSKMQLAVGELVSVVERLVHQTENVLICPEKSCPVGKRLRAQHETGATGPKGLQEILGDAFRAASKAEDKEAIKTLAASLVTAAKVCAVIFFFGLVSCASTDPKSFNPAEALYYKLYFSKYEKHLQK